MLRDADIEMAAIEESANRHAALRRRGICTHSWTQGRVDAAGNPNAGTCCKCLDCGRIFRSEAALEHSRVMADVEGVVV